MIEYSDTSYPKIRWTPREFDHRFNNAWIYYSRRFGKPELGLLPASIYTAIRYGDVSSSEWMESAANKTGVSIERLLDFCEYADSMLCTLERQRELEGYRRPLFETTSEETRKVDELNTNIETFILMFENLNSFAERYKVYTWYKRNLLALKSEIKNFKGVQNGKEQAQD